MPATTPAVSEEKLAANRANARKSTGPRTPAGRRRSSRNATTHAAYAADLVLPSESTANFVALRRAMLASLSPQTPFELALVDRAANLLWRLNRLQAAETGLLASEEADFADHARDFAEDYNADPDHEGHPRRLPPKRLAPADLPPGLATVMFFEHADNPLERLTRAEHRLQGMLHRTLNQLTALQKHRESPHHTPLPCPYLHDHDEEDYDADDESDLRPDHTTDTTAADAADAAEAPTHEPVQPDATATEKVRNEPTADNRPLTTDPLDIPSPHPEDTPIHQTPGDFPEYHPPYAP